MKIARRFTTAGQSPYAEIKFRDATSEIAIRTDRSSFS
jgi:hypothetical protein